LSTVDASFARQLDILPPSKLKGVDIIGCGGVGSATCLYLAKMGFRDFTLWDSDVVLQHNISNQMFGKSGINKFKSELVGESIKDMSPRDARVKVHTNRFTENDKFDNSIVISALDSMSSRRDVWDAIKNSYTVSLYIDTRMGGEVAKVYAVRPDSGEDRDFYERHLTQGEHHISCTAQAIAYNVGMIASIVGSNLRRFVCDLKVPRLIIGDSLNLEFTHLYGDT
jgi:molybdopterin/thiamine biosynthesis adenylyltransferase